MYNDSDDISTLAKPGSKPVMTNNQQPFYYLINATKKKKRLKNDKKNQLKRTRRVYILISEKIYLGLSTAVNTYGTCENCRNFQVLLGHGNVENR